MSICIHLLLLILLFPMNFIQASGTKDLASDLEISPSTDPSLQNQNQGNIEQKEKPKPKPKPKQKEVPLKSLKQIILEDVSSASSLSAPEKNSIEQEKSLSEKRKVIKSAFKITIQDEQLKDKGPLNGVFNKEAIEDLFKNEIFMADISDRLGKKNKKLYGKGRVYLKNINRKQGVAEILIYSTENRESKSLKDLIIDNLAKCRDLEDTELQTLKTPEAEAEGIYDGKYISNACQIDIEDELLKTKEQNKIEKLFDIYFKQKIADQVNKPNLNLDKHMSVYLELIKTQGNLKITLAETKKGKEPKLIEALKTLKKPLSSPEENTIEEAYGVQYINLAITLVWEDNRFKSGGEFDQSFALIDEILKNNTEVRTAWIDIANQQRRNRWEFQQVLPNDDNTIIRSRLNSGTYNFAMDVFTLSDSPKVAIQSHLLDWMDENIIMYRNKYESIRSSGAIKGFEKGRSLKQGLKLNEIYENRFYGGSLSSYYDNAKKLNPLLDDADFKHKVLDKINDYQKNNKEFKKTIDFVFSRDNLENIKIKAQNFRAGYKFDLMVYELYPPGESAPTEPSAGESAADAG